MNTATISMRPERSIVHRALDAEWTKTRTVRSTWTTLLGAAALTTVLAAIVAASQVAQWDDMSATQQADFDPTSAVLVGLLFVTGIVGSLGVRSIAAEHTTGMIRLTHTALPHPRSVLLAKAAVVATLTFPVALLGNLAAFMVGQHILDSKRIAAGLDDPGSVRALLFGALAASLAAIAGVGLGSLLRRTAAATSLLLTAIIGSQLIGIAVPEGARHYLPGYALQATVAARSSSDLLDPVAGLAAFAAFAAISFAVGIATAPDRRRDHPPRDLDTMRSLRYLGPRELRWEERPAARLKSDHEAVIRPVAASVCDIDRPLLLGNSPWHGPFAFGHEAVGEVVEAGDQVDGLSRGDLVAVTWHINCGVCDPCRAGHTAHCASVPPSAMYGLPVGGDWGGLFDDLVRVPYPDAMLTRLPTGTTPAEAVSAGDNLSLGYEIMAHHINAGRRRVLVLGSAAVGINQVAMATALGATEIVYVDTDPTNRAIAEQLGATTASGPPDRSLGRFDLAVDVSFNPTWLRSAVRIVVPDGFVECLGGYFDDVSLPLFDMYVNGVTLRLGRANTGPHVQPTLDLLQTRAIQPMTWSQTFDWDDMPNVLRDPPLKPVAVRPPITHTTHPISREVAQHDR